jgi:predicted helicase
VFHSPEYRNRYSELLKIDFPRLPLTSNIELFYTLAELGSELVKLHLLESSSPGKYVSFVQKSADLQVEKVSYSNKTAWINKAKTCGFKGLSEAVWNFHVGGYQVCQKWLKDRQAKGGKYPQPGRVLTKKDINHYQKMVVAINETIHIMPKVDEVIDKHGGWPDAFQSEE